MAFNRRAFLGFTATSMVVRKAGAQPPFPESGSDVEQAANGLYQQIEELLTLMLNRLPELAKVPQPERDDAFAVFNTEVTRRMTGVRETLRVLNTMQSAPPETVAFAGLAARLIDDMAKRATAKEAALQCYREGCERFWQSVASGNPELAELARRIREEVSKLQQQ